METSAKTSIERSKKLPAAMKEKILKLLVTGQKYLNTEYKNGVVVNLRTPRGMSKISKMVKGCSIGADKNGFFVYTHRARSKSYKDPLKIPKRAIDFIESTG
jgi:hypothetical protein